MHSWPHWKYHFTWLGPCTVRLGVGVVFSFSLLACMLVFFLALHVCLFACLCVFLLALLSLLLLLLLFFVCFACYFCLCSFFCLIYYYFCFQKQVLPTTTFCLLNIVCGWDRKRLVPLQHLANLVSVFSMLGYNLRPMKSWRKIRIVCKGIFGPTMNLCPRWEAPCLYSVFCSMCSSSSN